MSQPTDLANLGRTLHVGVILLNGITEILDVAPVDLLAGLTTRFVSQMPGEILSEDAKKQAIDAEFHWVSETGKPAQSRLTSNISLTPTDSFETCPRLDIVVMGANIEHEANEVEKAFIRKTYDESLAFITICGGMLAPLQAGILEGKTATAPRFLIESLRKQAPGTNWVEQRWVTDGKLWTSGALLNGIDLMSAFIQQNWPSGEGTLVNQMLKVGAWHTRDQHYKDVAWKE